MSTLKADTIVAADGSSPVTLTKQSAAKHWVNMNAGTTINDSFNTASVTDNGTGDHASTMTNAMANINYVVTGSNIGSPSNNSGEIAISAQHAHTTTKYEFKTRNNNGSYYDNDINGLHLSGDLA
jgi:hypothetical protein